MALHDMPAERSTGWSGQFQIDNASGCETRKGSAGDRLLSEIGFERVGGWFECGEADAAYGNAVAFLQVGGKPGCGDSDAHRAAVATQRLDDSRLLNQASEHSS